MRKPRPMPELSLLEYTYTYNPITGKIYRDGKLCNSWNRQGYNIVTVRKGMTLTVARLGWYLYYRKDPGVNYHVVHIDEKTDNSIKNLQLKKVPGAR